MNRFLKKLGPGLIFAGAAIGVSHLVQSTRAGADFGLGLVWALLLINLIKYPFFQFGPRYAAATGNSLLVGYKRLGKGVLIAYIGLTLLTMFTIQTAVTIVTAGIAVYLFGDMASISLWSVIITLLCASILIIGKYHFLDKAMKFIILLLTVSTVLAVGFAFGESTTVLSLQQIIPNNALEIGFLIAFMGWMPAPLDISIWHSLWTREKQKTEERHTKNSLFDFDIGFVGTVFLGLCFMLLGGLVMFGSGTSFSSSGGVFAGQLVEMYTSSLGSWAYWIIGAAALTTMFSTTLTTLDGSPRVMDEAISLLRNKPANLGYSLWLVVLVTGTIIILFFFTNEMGLLVQVATVVSFLTAPFYAICNYLSMTSAEVPEQDQPGRGLRLLSLISILLLIAFSFWYLTTL
ncbi:Nramp family divalent metal transporter [Croceiramulus getboli]|nr:Nramp family divalent metal transporter [Flavobacteriaceae bacterium YJPT1-3]